MPDSDRKQTPVQKAAADMLAGPTGEQVLASIRESVDEVVTKARTNALPAILGTATVSLVMEIPDSTTPVDAVNQVMQQVSLNGLRAYTFLVRDEVTQEVYAVLDGKMALLKPEDDS